MNTSLNYIGKELHTTVNGVLFIERIYGITSRGFYQTSLTNTMTGNVTYNQLDPETLQDILDEGRAKLVA